MNGQEAHLLVNHLPVIGALWSILLVAAALVKPGPVLSRVALVFTILVAIATVPAFLTGEPAEEVAEHLPGTGESVLHRHEDMAKRALVAGLVAGLAALTALPLTARKPSRRGPLAVTLIVLLIAAAFLAATGHVGGQVRRPELRGEAAATDLLHETDDH